MLRFEISEQDRDALPPIDVADDAVVIGSGAAARIRLPAEAAREAHVRIEGQVWTLLAEAKIGGLVRAAGDSGPLGRGIAVELGKYRVRVSPSPATAQAMSLQRTESLARELVRSLLGDGAAPTLEIERGIGAGTRRALPPPEAAFVIGRGDEATWVILDEDLSRAHVEIRRGWEGVTAVDLGAKNGTRVDGKKLGGEPVLLRDGSKLALGGVVLRFRDPAERHLRGEPPAERALPGTASAQPGTPPVAGPWPVLVFAAIAVLAVSALIWILVT